MENQPEFIIIGKIVKTSYRFSGAIYKSFPTLEETKEYLNNENIEVKSGGFNLEDIAEDEIVAYVDGSYKKIL